MSISQQVDELLAGLEVGNRSTIARAITLVESTRDTDRVAAAQLLDAISQTSQNSVRVGISGVPGVGKSTFIDSNPRPLPCKGSALAN